MNKVKLAELVIWAYLEGFKTARDVLAGMDDEMAEHFNTNVMPRMHKLFEEIIA